MEENQKIQLQGEGIEMRHWFDGKLSKEQWDKLNRLIEIELLLESESNKKIGTGGTRIFFVVDSLEDSEEIFDTLEQAEAWYLTLDSHDKPRLYIAVVRNAFEEQDEHNGTHWNYEDRSDTFEIIKFIKK